MVSRLRIDSAGVLYPASSIGEKDLGDPRGEEVANGRAFAAETWARCRILGTPGILVAAAFWAPLS